MPVHAATLASPTGVVPCVQTRNIRLVAGAKVIGWPRPVAKIEKKTVAPLATVTVELAPGVGGLKHPPGGVACALVWQIARVAASVLAGWPAGVGVAVQVTVPAAPILIAAVAITPVPVVPGMWTMPSCVSVSAIDSMSMIGVLPTLTMNVSTPDVTGAALVLVHWNTSAMSWLKVAVGVSEKNVVCVAPAAMSNGVSCVPIGAFAALVRW